MKFKISVPDANKLKVFLNSNPIDFVDVMVTKTVAYLISDNAEMYTHIFYEVITREGIDSILTFRLNRKKFSNMVINGFVEFIIEDKIKIKFYDTHNNFIYSMSVKHQTCYTAGYQQKLQLLDTVSQYLYFDIEPLISLIRVGKNLNSIVTVMNDVACVDANGIWVYQKIQCPNFSVHSSTLWFMLKYGTSIYSVQDLLVHTSDNVAIVAKKYKDNFQTDYDFIVKAGVSHKVTFGLTNLLDLCKKCITPDGSFVLDLENKCCVYTVDDAEKSVYETDITVLDIKSAREHKAAKNLENQLKNFSLNNSSTASSLSNSVHAIPKLVVPAVILQKILVIVGAKANVMLQIKKRFICINFNELLIVFRRRDFVDGKCDKVSV